MGTAEKSQRRYATGRRKAKEQTGFGFHFSINIEPGHTGYRGIRYQISNLTATC